MLEKVVETFFDNQIQKMQVIAGMKDKGSVHIRNHFPVITYESVDSPADEIKTLNPEHNILPLGIEHDARFSLAPGQVVVVGPIVHRVGGLGGGGCWQGRACELVTVLSCRGGIVSSLLK